MVRALQVGCAGKRVNSPANRFPLRKAALARRRGGANSGCCCHNLGTFAGGRMGGSRMRKLRVYSDLVVPTRDSEGNTALLAFLVEQDWSCAAALRRVQIFGANSTATPAHRKQKDQLQAARTIPPSHSARQASSRHLCCHKESAVASRLSNLAGWESTERHRRQHCVYETFLSAPRIEALLHLTTCRQYCDRAYGACCFGSSQSTPTLRLSWPWPRRA